MSVGWVERSEPHQNPSHCNWWGSLRSTHPTSYSSWNRETLFRERPSMTPRERVAAAMAHTQPDYTPCDYFATPEIRQALCDHFGVGSDDEICDRLGTDIRYVNPPYVGPTLKRFDDGSWIDEWGVRRRMMPNEYGEYAEAVGRPYAAFQTVEDVDRFPWPDPDWYDYRAIPALCAAPRDGDCHGRIFRPGLHQSRGHGPRRGASARGHRRTESGVPADGRDPAPFLPAANRAHARCGPGTDRHGALRRRFWQPARPADLAGHLRSPLCAVEEGVFRHGPLARGQGDAPLLRLQP